MKAPADCSSIEEVREAIDTLDREIVARLGRRFQYVKAVTRFKKTSDEVRAAERYQAVLHARACGPPKPGWTRTWSSACTAC